MLCLLVKSYMSSRHASARLEGVRRLALHARAHDASSSTHIVTSVARGLDARTGVTSRNHAIDQLAHTMLFSFPETANQQTGESQ
jgi:hypothetical protein